MVLVKICDYLFVTQPGQRGGVLITPSLHVNNPAWPD